MNVAITGGSGFIGSALLRRCLDKGDSVRVLTRGRRNVPSAASEFVADLASSTADLDDFVRGIDVLYHCAGEIADESKMRALHVDGTRRLVEAAAGRVGRWVQLSSVGAYGPRHAGVVSEATTETPVGPYERTKTESDALVTSAARRGAFSCAIVRPSTVFGPTMPNASLRQWVAAIQRGRFFFIGKPGAIANYVHVSAVVDAMLLSGGVELGTDRVFIVSESVKLERFVTIICDGLRRSVPALHVPERLARTAAWIGESMSKGFPLTRSRIDALTNRVRYDASRAQIELQWRPSVCLEDGLRDFVVRFAAQEQS